jgi:hypothetical protein
MATILRSILTSLHGRQMGLSVNGHLIVRQEPDQATFSVAKGATNIVLVSIQAKNNEGISYDGTFGTNAGTQTGTVWLSDSSDGAGLTATPPETLAAGASGTSLGALTTAKALKFITNTAGLFILSITNTAHTAFYVCAQLDKGRRIAPQITQLATGNYGP